jgi:hypothetical protein
VGGVLLLVLGLVVAGIILVFMLRPWPPRWWRWVGAAVLLGALGTFSYFVGRSRQVVIDADGQKVTLRTRFAGMGWENDWRLGTFAKIIVEQRITTQTKESSTRSRASRTTETTTNYHVSLEGPAAAVFLTMSEDVLTAEAEAGKVAALIGLPLFRRGYDIDVKYGKEAAEAAATKPEGMPDDMWRQMQEGRPGEDLSATHTFVNIRAKQGVETSIKPAIDSPVEK